MNKERTYNLCYIVDNKIRETIIKGSTRVCAWQKNKLDKNNYQLGELKILSNEAVKYNYCHETKI